MEEPDLESWAPEPDEERVQVLTQQQQVVHQTEQDLEGELEQEPEQAIGLEPAQEPAQEQVPAQGSPTHNRLPGAMRGFTPPPPGYAIEFGSGRFVPVHSMRGRMSYPAGYYFSQT